MFRKTLFNTAFLLTGTGYASADHDLGRIADCGSVFHRPDRWLRGVNGLSIKIFRYQLLFASIRAQLYKIRSPHGVFTRAMMADRSARMCLAR